MLETVLSLRQLGARIATAAVEPEFPGKAFLADLGFVDVGQPVLFDDAPRRGTLAQCIALEVSLAADVCPPDRAFLEGGVRGARADVLCALTDTSAALPQAPLVVEVEENRRATGTVPGLHAVRVPAEHEAGEFPLPFLGRHDLLVGRPSVR